MGIWSALPEKRGFHSAYHRVSTSDKKQRSMNILEEIDRQTPLPQDLAYLLKKLWRRGFPV